MDTGRGDGVGGDEYRGHHGNIHTTECKVDASGDLLYDPGDSPWGCDTLEGRERVGGGPRGRDACAPVGLHVSVCA